MKEVQMYQTITNMTEGRIYFYVQVKEYEKYIRQDIFSIPMTQYQEIATKHPEYEDADIDAEVVLGVYKNIYAGERFHLTIEGVDKTPEIKPADQEIREELYSKNYTLSELFALLDEEENNFKKLTGILRITAKFKMIVLNELITKTFEDMRQEYEEVERGIIL